MSDDEHQYNHEETAGGTFQQQASNISRNDYIVFDNRPCKVVEVSSSKTGNYGHAQYHFVAIDIFTGQNFEDTVSSSHNCDVPYVHRTDYQLIDIIEDEYLSLLAGGGSTKDDIKLPTDENLLLQIKDAFNKGKDLIVTVMSALGEEQICALKEIGQSHDVDL